MKMLAVVVLCDAQRVFLQRRIVKHHFVEILGTCFLASLFSLFATAGLSRLAGLDTTIARSLFARSITVPLALPITEAMGGIASVTAVLVCATGLLGAALGQAFMTAMGHEKNDEILRGVAQAASAHGLGTSALAESEPEALPFAAVTIAAMGTISNLLLMVPAIKGALVALLG
jgi:putative effector of murein hydrolase